MIDDERFALVMSVNLYGPFLWCRALLPGMAAAARGAVVNVSSLGGPLEERHGGSRTPPARRVCSASRATSRSTTARAAVRVNAICPGGVDTPMLRAAGACARRAERESGGRAERIAAYRLLHADQATLHPEEQAAAIDLPRLRRRLVRERRVARR
jgi:NAD(P)-dependent dehydrogenase (short-subunit alcohol dehydrogenase family)